MPRQESEPTRRRRLAPVVAVAAALLAGCAGTGAGAPPVTRAQVEDVLAQRSAAVLRHDAPALAATADPASTTAVRELGPDVAQLQLTSWAYDVRSVTPGPGAAATVHALLRYRLAGDPADATAARVLVVAPGPTRTAGVRVRSDEAEGAALPWDLGPVRWTDGAAARVLWTVRARADGAPLGAADLPAVAARAAGAVTAVWRTPWRRVPVVVAVDGPGQLGRLTGRPVAPDGPAAVTTADRVYVDTAAYALLPPEGRRVLVTHELTHLATGAAADPGVPQWLEEGFADYVGLKGSSLTVADVAGVLLSRVGASGDAPAALPADADFTAGGDTEAAAYAGAWLACRLIAERAGERALVTVYRDASAAGAGAALLRVTGHGTDWWAAQWRTDLARLARAAGGAGSGGSAR